MFRRGVTASATMPRQNLHLSSLKYAEVNCGGYFIHAPIFLVNAFKVIRDNDKNVGIFRTAGQQKRVKQLKTTFFGDAIPDDAPVNDVCDAVKAFFRDLEEPLLTSAIEKQFVRFSSTISREDIRLRSILQLCRVLNQRHRETLAFLMWQLKEIAESSKENRMDVSNLAMVFSMSIFRYEQKSATVQMEEGKKDAAMKAGVVDLLIRNAEKLCALARRSERMPNKKGMRCKGSPAKVSTKIAVEASSPVPRDMENQQRQADKIGEGDFEFVRPVCPSVVPEQPVQLEYKEENILQEVNEPNLERFQPMLNSGDHHAGGGLFLSPINLQQQPFGSMLNQPNLLELEPLVPAKLARSISDSTEKKRSQDAEVGLRRRSIGAQSKIRRGQPNTIYSGLDKLKRKSTSSRSSPIADVTKIDVPLDPVQFSLGAVAQSLTKIQTPPLLISKAQNLRLDEKEEETDTFADSECRKLELLSSKLPPPTGIIRMSSVPTRDRPSIAFIRHSNRGHVMRKAAAYENVVKKQSNTPDQGTTMKKPPLVPTFTQVAGSKRRSPTKPYQSTITFCANSPGVKL